MVLKTFQGQGNFLTEDQGEDLQGAQADAATEKSLGAFGDITQQVETSIPFAQDLAEEHIISFENPTASQAFYQQYAPYSYNMVPTPEQSAEWECQPDLQSPGRNARHPGRKHGIPDDHPEVQD